MSGITIYHNPRCSKSRQTLQLLEDRGIEPEVVHYLDAPPGVERLDALCAMLGRDPLDLIRVKEARFKELGLGKNEGRDRLEWLTLMHDNPILIERPIVVAGERAAVGRPPEAVLDIL